MNTKHVPISIIIADDHEIFRNGFKLLLRNQEQLQLVAEAGNGKELLQLVEQHKPDVVITDIMMPVLDGIQACKIIHSNFGATRVIALSMFNEENLVIDMLEAGANGYLLKNTNKAELLDAVRTVYLGENYYCASTSLKLAKMIAESRYHPSRPMPRERFTERELDIIRLICQQRMNKEIAENLGISVRTVESYREKIQEKTGARNAIGVVIYAIRHRIFEI